MVTVVYFDDLVVIVSNRVGQPTCNKNPYNLEKKQVLYWFGTAASHIQ